MAGYDEGSVTEYDELPARRLAPGLRAGPSRPHGPGGIAAPRLPGPLVLAGQIDAPRREPGCRSTHAVQTEPDLCVLITGDGVGNDDGTSRGWTARRQHFTASIVTARPRVNRRLESVQPRRRCTQPTETDSLPDAGARVEHSPGLPRDRWVSARTPLRTGT